MDPFTAHLPRESLRQLSNTTSRSSIASKLSIAAEGSKSSSEEESALLLGTFRESLLAVIFEETFNGFLREDHGTTDIGLQRLHKGLKGLFEERLLAAALDGEYRRVELQAREAFMLLDVGEGLSQVVGLGVLTEVVISERSRNVMRYMMDSDLSMSSELLFSSEYSAVATDIAWPFGASVPLSFTHPWNQRTVGKASITAPGL